MRKKIVKASLTLLALATLTLVDSPLANAGPSGDAAERTAGTNAWSCYTSWLPDGPVPAGATQRYKNCNPFDVWVQPVYSQFNTTWTYQPACTFVQRNAETAWYFPTTHPATYTTRICVPGRELEGVVLLDPWN